VDGLVALPLDARTREQLEWIGDEIVDAGGEATIWIGRLASARAERDVAGRMAATVAAEYQRVIDAAADANDRDPVARRRTFERLRRELRRVGQRDFFPPTERDRAHEAVDQLAASVDVLQ